MQDKPLLQVGLPALLLSYTHTHTHGFTVTIVEVGLLNYSVSNRFLFHSCTQSLIPARMWEIIPIVHFTLLNINFICCLKLWIEHFGWRCLVWFVVFQAHWVYTFSKLAIPPLTLVFRIPTLLSFSLLLWYALVMSKRVSKERGQPGICVMLKLIENECGHHG